MPELSISDDVLGTLHWDDQLKWYSGEREIAPGHRIGVSFSPDDGKLAEILIQARQAYQHLQQHEAALREAAADTLLPLHNEAWNDGPPIDRDTFTGRMLLEDISIYGDGSAEISYNDGDLFWGHTIIVSLRDDRTFEDAAIQG